MIKLVIILIFVISNSWSQTIMNINLKNGTTQSFYISDIRKLTFSGMVGIVEQGTVKNVLNSFTLLQNFPNPFNPSTSIIYEIPETGNVSVDIYNISGQLIRPLDTGSKNAGSHTIKWDGLNSYGQSVASGIYLLKVKYNSSLLTKKLVLIK